MKKKTTKQPKEKMIKESVAKEKFDAIKSLSMNTSHYACKCMEEILAEFGHFVEQVKATNPGEQTLLKTLADEEIDFIEERMKFVQMVKAITGKYAEEDEDDED